MKNAKAKAQENNAKEGPYRYKKIKQYVYDMEEVLGKGNFSTVYRGRSQNRNDEVAVKVVKLSSLTFQKLEELLEQEIAITRSLDHPNCIRCHEVLKSVNHCYFITELCHDGTMEKLLKKRGSMSEDEAWPYIRDVYQGLKYLASRNIIHRDVKLANIFLNQGTAKLADFGFAVYTKENFKDINIGSPLYMAPEGYIDNIYGPKTDVWAFGLVVYELLHGKAPLSHITTQEDLRRLLKIPIKHNQLRADLSPEVRQLITRCLEVKEEERISMEEIENLPYFQNKLESKFISQVKLNSLKFRRLSVPSTMQFIRTPVKNLNETVDKENLTPGVPPSKGPQKCMTFKELPTPKRIEKVPSDQIEENTSIMLDYRDQDLIRDNVTFNQSIGLIHYCRIGYKLVQEQLPGDLSKMVKSIIMKILEELQYRINSDKIVYTDEQNRAKKESKLRLVVTEYLAKYGKELQGDRTQVILPHLSDSLRRHLLEQEKHVQKNTYEVYLSMLFSTFTESLIGAVKGKNYHLFGENGVIDSCLEQKHVPQDAQSYEQSKQKYSEYISPVEQKS